MTSIPVLTFSYPICVFPMPGAPQNSVILPVGTPPPSMSSKRSQNVTTQLAFCSCCNISKALLLLGLQMVFAGGEPFSEMDGDLLTVWRTLSASSLLMPISVITNKRTFVTSYMRRIHSGRGEGGGRQKPQPHFLRQENKNQFIKLLPFLFCFVFVANI